MKDTKPAKTQDDGSEEGGFIRLTTDDVKDNLLDAIFDDILEAVRLDGELFGLLPTPNLGGKEVDIFAPVAILMPIDKFWIPDYLIQEKPGE